ncbi:MAG: peptidylprolyl isomerase [Bacteroidia bacterium]|nr:peptidylprolyl isomerase [Bacteroidia bacterium]
MKKGLFIIILVYTTMQAFAQGIDKPRYQIVTHRAGNYLGTIQIELFPLITPLATANFDSLVNAQAYDSTAFHRVVPGFVIQGGDPNSINGPVSTWGMGNPNQPNVNAEFNVVQHIRGRMGAARDVDTNSANSQFYFCVAPALFLDGNYTVYGQVTSGMDVVDTIVLSPRDANDVPLQKIEMFVTNIGVNDSVPAAPALVQPATASVGIASTQLFTWLADNQAIMYRAEFSTDSTFATIDYKINCGVKQLAFNGLSGNTVYYWRVISNNGGHESLPSMVYSFTTAPAGPTLVLPADSATGVNLNPVFNWNAAPGATSYTLQVAKFATFTPAALVINQPGITGTAYMGNNLLPNNKYYWRVQSFTGTAAGNFSSKFLFFTGTTTGIAQVNTINNAYPNPANDVVYLPINTNTNTITLEDVNGRMLQQQHIRNHTQSLFAFDVSTIPAGNYLFVVSESDKANVYNVTIQK